MNRAEKLKIIDSVLSGYNAPLRQLQRQRQKEQMPFLECYGVIDIRQCSPLLLDLTVMPTESILDGRKNHYLSLGDCLRRFDLSEWKKPYYSYSAAGSIEADESSYDEIVLEYIHIHRRNYSTTYIPHQTIGELRRYFRQCASSLEQSFVLLSFESDPALLRVPVTAKTKVS